MEYRFARPLSLQQFRDFAIEGDVNAARHLTRQQLELTVIELVKQYQALPLQSRMTIDGALTIAMQAATRGELCE